MNCLMVRLSTWICLVCSICFFGLSILLHKTSFDSEQNPLLFLIVIGIVFLLVYCINSMITISKQQNNYVFTLRGWRTKGRRDLLLFLTELLFIISELVLFSVCYFCIFPDHTFKQLLYPIAVLIIFYLVRSSKSYTMFAISYWGRVLFVILMAGLVVLGFYTKIQALEKCGEDEVYEFSNYEEYAKCKALLIEGRESYVVLEHKNTTAYVRGLTDDLTDVFVFDTDKDYRDFIELKTMGEDNFVPVLSGGTTLDDGNLAVTYHPCFDFTDYVYSIRSTLEDTIIIYYYFVVVASLIMFISYRIINRNSRKKVSVLLVLLMMLCCACSESGKETERLQLEEGSSKEISMQSLVNASAVTRITVFFEGKEYTINDTAKISQLKKKWEKATLEDVDVSLVKEELPPGFCYTITLTTGDKSK